MKKISTKTTLKTLILGCLLLGNNLLIAQCHIDDWTALKALYESTGGDNWGNNTNWGEVKGDTPTNTCNLENLFGVDLNSSGRIVGLNLDSNQLNGSIPPELGKLKKLDRLYLKNSQLTGSIPPELADIWNLRVLDLQNNKLSGSIPPELSKLNNLEYLRLESNQLTGNIPPEFGNFGIMRDFHLNDNQLSGSIPSSFWQLRSFYALRIQNNNLSGCYPNGILPFCLSSADHNFYISDGNNFDATWSDFCATEAGICNAQCQIDDWLALNTLYERTNGDNWVNNTNWEEVKGDYPTDNCDLENLAGVSVNENGRVNGLNLSENQLSGNIPPELKNLIYLTDLDLHSNQLNDSIPPELGKLYYLTSLNLSDNQLTGNIPPEWRLLLNLEMLAINNNNLGGCYPNTINTFCTQLTDSNFEGNSDISDDNNFEATWENFCTTGAGSCNCNIDDWTALKVLYESTDGDNWTYNTNWETIIGDAPPAFCNLQNLHGVYLNESGRVNFLILSSNQLNGSIPPELNKLSHLTELYLNNNQLSGSISSELGNLINLTGLWLNKNQLSGSIPEQLFDLSDLKSLRLSENQLSGSIPQGLGSLSNLNLLTIANNNLNGCYPNSLLPFCKRFGSNDDIGKGNNFEATWESFCDNGSGACLTECNMDDWTALKALYESTNGDNWEDNTNWEEVTRDSPSKNCIFSNMYGVQFDISGRVSSLSLWGNQLSGSIPPQLGNLSHLKYLGLYRNQLSGNIPAELGNLSKLEELLLYNNQLTGSIPPEFENLSSLAYLEMTNNNLSGCYPDNIILFCTQFRSNHYISSGNNFFSTWEDFCNGETTTCLTSACETNWVITENSPFYNVYQSSNFINTNGNVTIEANEHVEYRANEVNLNQGFIVEVEADFIVLIGGCD